MRSDGFPIRLGGMFGLLGRRGLRVGSVVRAGDRVQAEVAGRPLFYECADVTLTSFPEAFAGPFLLPAMKLRRRLQIDEPVDAQWLAGLARLDAIYKRWWEYRSAMPVRAVASSDGEMPRAEVGACFTGGVDSFYTQLRGERRSDTLVFVHGFDIPLGGRALCDAFEPSFRRVAAALGKRAILVRTNLREHPLFARVSWERTHGAALAAVGHLLADAMGTLIIPSSYTHETPQPWGTHWETDFLWSSRRLQVVHDDPILHRRAKLRAIAHEPLVWENLRVCWENRTEALNCSRCEKCLRTMIILAGCEVLEKYTVFDSSISLANRIDQFPSVPAHLLYVYEALAEDPLPADVRAAVRGLVARTRAALAI